MKQTNNHEKTKQKGRRAVKLALAALLILVLFGVYQCTSKKQEGAEKAKNDVVTEYEDGVDAITEIDLSERQAAVDKAVEEGMMHVNYLPETVFEGTVSKRFNIKNIKNNHAPIQFTIYDEEGTLIYASKLIAPGYEMNSIKLTKELSKGIHKCTIKVKYAQTGSVSAAFPLTIEVK